MIGISTRGDFNNTLGSLTRILKGDIYSDLDRYGRMGVAALSSATPVRTGLSASSWHYYIVKEHGKPGIKWYNNNQINGSGPPVVILLQYGHATGTGGYVAGRDFINPAIRPIFEEIANDVWKKVTA